MKIFLAFVFGIGATLFMCSAAVMTGVPGLIFAIGLTLMLFAIIGVCEK